jgi:hypothetical protein
MSAELFQTIVNAVLLIGVTLTLGSIFRMRFDAFERHIELFEERMMDHFDTLERRFDALEQRA